MTLPPHVLIALVERFDANGDGCVSIPEFMAFMQGNKDTMEMLADAPKVGQEQEQASPMMASQSSLESYPAYMLARPAPGGSTRCSVSCRCARSLT